MPVKFVAAEELILPTENASGDAVAEYAELLVSRTLSNELKVGLKRPL